MENHTFVICAYKKSQYLEACIKSLKKQTVKSNIIIVTSTPNSFISDMADKYNLPFFVNPGEGGITQDWNFGYKCAKESFQSRYITIAHQDDVYEKDYLAAIQHYEKKAKHPLILFTDYFEIRNEKRVSNNKILSVKRIMLVPLRCSWLWNSRWTRRRILSMGSPICCPSVTFAVENLPDVIFDNHYRACEDWEAWEKLSKSKGAFVYIPKMLMGHRIHDESETTAAIIDNTRTKEEFEMFCKFWPKSIAKLILHEYSKGQQSNQV
ncbi:MAG: glycosyltransferase family A protein [Eubacteriales bacterium]|nr:glycosyltransferase family A protein [Eubacteriales bacterium]